LVELLFGVGLIAVISAMTIPASMNTMSHLRISGDAHGMVNNVLTAKMRAASDFTRTRLFVDLADRSYHIETWRKSGTPGWITQGGIVGLSQGISFSFGSLASAPPNTQATIAQAPACLDDEGTAIGDTACVLFNTRGIPIDSTGGPTGVDALYATDGTAVYGATVSATGFVQLWRSRSATASWVRQ